MSAAAGAAGGQGGPAAEPVEIELKFQVPAAARDAVQRAVATATAQVTRLQAIYADTADDRLARAAMALRLRQEGSVWVQTLKGRGDGLMQRLEHELHLPPQRGEPLLDPGRHAGTEAGARLAALLADGAVLQPLYRTDIRRTHRRVRTGGATIEIAFDEGRILAGERTLAVCEIEFELLSGPPQALLALAARWVGRHGLWLDVRSKSERGHRLARGLDEVPAVKAAPLELRRSMSCAQALALMLQSSLAQLLPNAAELGGGSRAAEPLHQLRVGLRRMRSALRLFGGWAADPAAAQALEQRLREPFARLGAARDQDALAASLLPALAAAGGPPCELPRPASDDPGAVVREPAFSLLVLQALGLTLPAAPDGPPATDPIETPAAEPPALRDAARHVLQRAFAQFKADAQAFGTAPPEVQHRARKRLKRLRYGLEFTAALFPRKATRQMLAAQRAALGALGAHNDLLVARQRFCCAGGGGSACLVCARLAGGPARAAAAGRPPRAAQAGQGPQGLAPLRPAPGRRR